MAVIKIQSFGGELPSASERALPPGAARTSQNLSASSMEFRPLKGDKTETGVTIATGAKSLYRLHDVWTASTSSLSYVKGQIDGADDKTYYTGDGAPKAKKGSGDARQLGVPRPAKPTISTTWKSGLTSTFTARDAAAWVDTQLVPQLVAAINDTLYEDRFYDAGTADSANPDTPRAGPFKRHGLDWIDPNDSDTWNLQYKLPTMAAAKAAGLNDARIWIEEDADGNAVLRITCLPLWGHIPAGNGLINRFAAIQNPRVSGSQLMSADLLDDLVADVVKTFDPNDASLNAARRSLDLTVLEWISAIELTLTPVVGVGSKPSIPVDPVTGNQIPENVTSWNELENQYTTARHEEWVAYDALLATYQASVKLAGTTEATIAAEKAQRVTRVADLQAQALRINNEIQAEYIRRKESVHDWMRTWANSRHFDFDQDDSDSNVVAVDADRLIDSRYYLMTFVSDWGEESAPGPVSDLIEVDQYHDVTITAPTLNTARHVAGWRLYRSNSGVTETNFQLVKDYSSVEGALPASFTDDLPGSALQEVLPTIDWDEPPSSLQGLTGMANGVMAGYFDDTVCFCEPYAPYAWPVKYQLTVRDAIVGMGAYGQSLVVLTKGPAYLITGSDSASMVMQELEGEQSCTSAASIAVVPGGVLYASPDGLCLANHNGVQVVTGSLFTRDDWQVLTTSSIIGELHDSSYYFFYTGSGGGCFAFDFASKKLSRIAFASTVTALYSDRETDTLYAASGTSVLSLFQHATDKRTGLYRTGVIKLSRHEPFAWLQVDSDFSSAVTVRWYGDFDAGGARQLVKESVVTSYAPVRLPAGRYLEHVLEIESKARITSVTMAGSTQELQAA